MNVHRLFALSMTAVVLAACSGGGGAAPPHPADSPAGATPTLTKHAPNGTLTLKFPSNYVRIKAKQPAALARKMAAKAASSAKRHPAFVDPSSGTYLDVEVTTTTNNGAVSSYMAAINIPIVDSQTNTQSIPIYLAPGYDSILVQEYGGIISNVSGGYLLAQGTSKQPEYEGSANNYSPAVTMQLVMEDAVVTTNVSSFSSGNAGYMQTSNNFSTSDDASYYTICLEQNHQSVYFLPVDEFSGTEAFVENPGDVTPYDNGLPYIADVGNFSSSGSSTYAANAFGGYTINFDTSSSPLVMGVTYDGVPYPTTQPIAFSSGGVISAFPATETTYYAKIELTGTFDCNHGL